MPVNIEIKARVRDFKSLQETAARISDTPCQLIPQQDTFFSCPQGRLKLRELSPNSGQLIYYQRQDVSGPKHSEYFIYTTDDPGNLKLILAKTYGIRGIVNKVRYLYLVGQTRIHLDDVLGLGHFMELEVVLKPEQTDSEGQAIAKSLMDELGIQDSDLIESAYMDLMEK